MAEWKRYQWFDLPEDELPWKALSEVPVMPDLPVLTAPDLREPFAPEATYFTLLDRDWEGHVQGARVLITPTVIAIELPEEEDFLGD